MSKAFHDYRCPTWGLAHVVRDHLVEISIGGSAGAPFCPICALSGTSVKMEVIPQIGRMDIGGVKGAAFQSFYTYNGRNERVFVDSVHTLRQIERDSEQDHRNGEGQPLVFRTWSNDPSNKDASALHRSFVGGEQPTEASKRRFGHPLRSAEEPDTGYGPGVTDSNTSALGMEGKG